MKIEAQGIGYRYPKAKEHTIKNINFELNQGEVLSILGPNGAGKTTLLNCLANLSTITEGDMLLDGKSIRKMSRKEAAKYIGYVPQFHQAIYGYTVEEFVTMGRAPYIDIMGTPKKKDVEKANDVIKMMNIEHLAKKDYTLLSGGEKQQAMIARTLVQNPQMILFDEPTNHLDYGNQVRALQMIKKLSTEGYTIIMTTHNPDHALMLGGKAGIVDHNQKFKIGRSEDILVEENLKNIYQIDVKMVHVPEVDRTICVPSKIDL